jgi:hypothetical protein
MAQAPSSAASTVGDKLWIWTHAAGAHDTGFTTRHEGYRIPGKSRMTPVEGAVYLDIHNLMFIRYFDVPEPPLDPYMISFRPMKKVVVPLVDAGGLTQPEVREHVLDLPRRYPNIVGFVMDDFFSKAGGPVLPPADIAKLRERLVIDGRRMDLYVVLYAAQLEWPVAEALSHCDKVTFWTWQSEDLERLEENFARVEELSPGKGRLLGCYMWDYGNKAPMPMDRMQKQLDIGLRWLKEKRIEGMIFLGSNICDLGFEPVELTRRWIAEHRDEVI